MRLTHLALACCLLGTWPTNAPAAEETPPTPSPATAPQESLWHGFRRLTFPFMGHTAWVTLPKEAAALRPALDRIRRQGHARVVFLGGSITQNPGWQERLAAESRSIGSYRSLDRRLIQ